MSVPWHRTLTRFLTLAALGVGGCGAESTGPIIGSFVPEPRPTLAADYRPTGHASAGDVFVHLFEWTWPDVAAECESVLGPAGWKAVQVSPPQEHGISPGFPWYQPSPGAIGASWP